MGYGDSYGEAYGDGEETVNPPDDGDGEGGWVDTGDDSVAWQAWALDSDDPSRYDVAVGSLRISSDAPTQPVEAPIGWVSVDFDPDGNGDIDRLPVFDTRKLDYPCWRVYFPSADRVGAFRVLPRGEASHPELSIETRDGVWAVDNDGYTDPTAPDDDPEPDPDPDPPPDDDPEPDEELIDDFDHSISGYYEEDRRNYDITTRWGHYSRPSLRHNSEQYVGGLIWSQDGLPNYPSQGDRIVYYWQTSHGSDDLAFGQRDRVYHRLRFGMHDTDNFYAASVAVNNERINLAEKTASTAWEPFAVSDCRPIPANTRIRTEVGWNDDGRLGMGLFDDEHEVSLGGIEFTAPQHHHTSGGGIGWNHTVAVSDCDLLTDYCRRDVDVYPL